MRGHIKTVNFINKDDLKWIAYNIEHKSNDKHQSSFESRIERFSFSVYKGRLLFKETGCLCNIYGEVVSLHSNRIIDKTSSIDEDLLIAS